jgi:endonuclease/exonuclease/phosphatase family metal-dependent hydrolase
VSVHDRPSGATSVESRALAGLQGLCHAAAMASLRVATWNIAGARREQTNQVDLDAVVAGVRALGVGLLAVQEVDPDRSRRIVWMIKRMIKQSRQLDGSMGMKHEILNLVVDPHEVIRVTRALTPFPWTH